MKSFVFALIVFSTSVVQAAPDSVEVRRFYQDGRPIPPEMIPVIYDKDITPGGWRFNDEEWMDLQVRRPKQPSFYQDPEHGSNGGVDWA